MNAKFALLISALAIAPTAWAVSQSDVLPDDWYLRIIPQFDRSDKTPAPAPERKVVRAASQPADTVPVQADTTPARDVTSRISRPSTEDPAGEPDGSEQNKQAVLEEWRRASRSIAPVGDASPGNVPLLVENTHSAAASTPASPRTPTKALPGPDAAAWTAKTELARQMKELEELVVSVRETAGDAPARSPVAPDTQGRSGETGEAGPQLSPPDNVSVASIAPADATTPGQDAVVSPPAKPRAQDDDVDAGGSTAPPKVAAATIGSPETQAPARQTNDPAAAAGTAPAKTAAATIGSPETQAPARQTNDPATIARINQPKAAAIPVPIQFIYRETTFTPSGDTAANLLLSYVTASRAPSITLSGHADERASADYNMALSRRRLESVADFLRKGGYEGELVLVPLGESRPYTGVDRTKYPPEDLFELDRRVELHLGGFRYGQIGTSGSDGS